MKTSYIPVGCQGENKEGDSGQLSSQHLSARSRPTLGPGWSCTLMLINATDSQAASPPRLLEVRDGIKKGQECFRSIHPCKTKFGKNLSLHTNQLHTSSGMSTSKREGGQPRPILLFVPSSHNTGSQTRLAS